MVISVGGSTRHPPAEGDNSRTGCNTTKKNQAALIQPATAATERAPASSTHRNISSRRALNARNFKTC
jgi:hypothetical protein